MEISANVNSTHISHHPGGLVGAGVAPTLIYLELFLGGKSHFSIAQKNDNVARRIGQGMMALLLGYAHRVEDSVAKKLQISYRFKIIASVDRTGI